MKWLPGILMVMVLWGFNCFAAGGAGIAGQWAVADGKSRVEVYQAADGTFEGRVCWLKDPGYLAGDPIEKFGFVRPNGGADEPIQASLAERLNTPAAKPLGDHVGKVLGIGSVGENFSA